ncbi:MAG: DegT/DnrJ/EryC1/StrS family aminotransferase [Candidatus Latescibacterota bacterium]|nr:MAG: DegT/DnrJ/EryC1/StrS family aminotransferase [Candidatus Latescibacterota bacterium]
MHVPLVDLRAQYATIRNEVEPCLQRICASQSFVLGPEVEALEREIANYVRAPHAIGCASGTDALELALLACGVGSGDEVITSAFSFIAGAEAIMLRGARPVFVDIDPDTFNLDTDALERAITSRTRAILPTDLFGQCADMSNVVGIAELHGVTVIEDAAQSLGAEHDGRRAGEMAPFTTFSFYPSKNLGAFGDGGLITALDDDTAGALRCLRTHGESERYVHAQVGRNSRLDALQAAILRIKLRHLDQWTALRQAHAADYTKQLQERGLTERVRPPVTAATSTRHVFNQYTVRVESREELRAHLQSCDVGTAIYYPVALHRQPCFRGVVDAKLQLPDSERAAAEVLSLPLYPELTEAQRTFVVDRIAEFYA